VALSVLEPLDLKSYFCHLLNMIIWHLELCKRRFTFRPNVFNQKASAVVWLDETILWSLRLRDWTRMLPGAWESRDQIPARGGRAHSLIFAMISGVPDFASPS